MPRVNDSVDDALAVEVEEPQSWRGSPSVQVAVNLCDLDRVAQIIRDSLLSGKLDATEAVITDFNMLDESAVRFTCDPLTAACICDTLRNHDKAVGQHQTRCYVKNAKSWIKVPGNVPLTVVEGGVVKLNPEVFRVKVRVVDFVAPKNHATATRFGR